MGFKTHGDQKLVYRTSGDGEQRKHQGVHNDPADEMRKIDHGLDGLLKLLIMEFIQKKCQNDRDRESDEKLCHTNEQRVSDDAPCNITAEETGEVFHTAPCGEEDSALYLVGLESKYDTIHRACS